MSADSQHVFQPEEIERISERLIRWYEGSHRILPWRELASSLEIPQNERAYGVWVSEVMLQQTQVKTVVDYFVRWMQRWPTVDALSRASPEEVNQAWSGLGYYRRARMLHEGAIMVAEQHGGIIPCTAVALLAIPGIGRYTAGAIASIAFGQCEPLVDGNVVRVLSRLRALGIDPKSAAAVRHHWRLAGSLVAGQRRPDLLNQALMELGATLCTPKAPVLCGECPVSADCMARREGAGCAEGSSCELCGEPEEGAGGGVTRYPRITKAKAQKPKSTWVALVRDASGRFLCVQRPATGLLAGLWEFPQVDFQPSDSSNDDALEANKLIGTAEMDQYVLNLLDVSLSDLLIQENSRREYIGTLTHLFTHIKQTLFIESIQIDHFDHELKGKTKNEIAYQWLTQIELKEEALSTGMRKCLEMFNKTQQAKKREITLIDMLKNPKKNVKKSRSK